MEQHQGTPIGVAILGIAELSTIAKAEGVIFLNHLSSNTFPRNPVDPNIAIFISVL